jgi:hypothetical protein
MKKWLRKIIYFLYDTFHPSHIKNPILQVNPKLIAKQAINYKPLSYKRYFGHNIRIYGVVTLLENLKYRVIEDIPFYQAIRSRYVDGLDWESSHVSAIFLNMYPHFASTFDQSKFEAKWDDVYNSLIQHGYISHEKLGLHKTQLIEVLVNQEGEMCMIDGRHRLYLAKLLNIGKVDVIVNFIDERFWMSLNPNGKEDLQRHFDNLDIH